MRLTARTRKGEAVQTRVYVYLLVQGQVAFSQRDEVRANAVLEAIQLVMGDVRLGFALSNNIAKSRE